MNYEEEQVIYDLRKKNVAFKDGLIDVAKAKDLGNKSWGKIGFLTNYKGWRLIGLRDYNNTEVKAKEPILIHNPVLKNQRMIMH